MATVELRFSPLPEHVRTARMIAAAIGRRSGVPDYLIDEVKLAVSEASARAVALHQRTDCADLVVVSLVGDVDTFTVEVTDYAPAGEGLLPGEGPDVTNPIELIDTATPAEGLAEPDQLGAMPSGLGLAILRGLVDDVQIRPAANGGGSVVSMSWVLPEPDKDDDG